MSFLPASAIDAGELREKLKKRLPLYMIPVFVMLDSLPMTAHGKVDYQLHRAGRFHSIQGTRMLLHAPLEEVLAKIWADVLGYRASRR